MFGLGVLSVARALGSTTNDDDFRGVNFLQEHDVVVRRQGEQLLQEVVHIIQCHCEGWIKWWGRSRNWG